MFGFNWSGWVPASDANMENNVRVRRTIPILRSTTHAAPPTTGLLALYLWIAESVDKARFVFAQSIRRGGRVYILVASLLVAILTILNMILFARFTLVNAFVLVTSVAIFAFLVSVERQIQDHMITFFSFKDQKACAPTLALSPEWGTSCEEKRSRIDARSKYTTETESLWSRMKAVLLNLGYDHEACQYHYEWVRLCNSTDRVAKWAASRAKTRSIVR